MAISATLVKELRERTGLGMMLCKKALEESAGDMEKAIENLRKQGEATLAKRAGKEAKEGTIAVQSSAAATAMVEVNAETDFVARNEDFTAFVAALTPLVLARQPADMAAALKLTSPAFGGRTVEERLLELTAKIGERISFRRFHIDRPAADERVFTYVHGGGRIGIVLVLKSTNPAVLASEAGLALGKDCAMQVAAANPMAVSREAIPADVVAKEREIYFTQAQNSGKPEKVWDRIVEGKLAKFYEQAVITEQPYIKEPAIKVAARIKQVEGDSGARISVRAFVRYELGG